MKPKPSDTDIRYGGRTVRVEVYINTNDSLEAIAFRIKDAAQGPEYNMSVVAVGFVEDPEAIKRLWASVVSAATENTKRTEN